MATDAKRPSQHDVFINFRGAKLRHNFVAHLKSALKMEGFNALVEQDDSRGGDHINLLFKKIEESRIALTIFSNKYAESSWCLDELVKIRERVEEGTLVVIPIFYKMNPSDVKGLEGDFGFKLWNHVKHTSEFDKLKKWKEALDFVSQKAVLVLTETRTEFIKSITKEVKKVIRNLEKQLDPGFHRTEKLEQVDSETDANLEELADENVRGEANMYKSRSEDDIFFGKENSDAVPNLQNSFESKQSSIMANNEKHAPPHQVFTNFQRGDVGFSFVSHLVSALVRKEISVLIEKDKKSGEEDAGKLFKKIEDAKIALVVFSTSYSESTFCLNELVKIKECMDEGKLKVIPIFYKVEPSHVQQLNGDFGCKLWNFWRLHRDHNIIKWVEAGAVPELFLTWGI